MAGESLVGINIDQTLRADLAFAGLVGTKVSGRNIAVMMTWAVWMSFLAVVVVPWSTRIWCFVCPLPALGEFVQRGALTEVRQAACRLGAACATMRYCGAA